MRTLKYSVDRHLGEMPNICDNYAFVSGSPATLDILMAAQFEPHLLFPAPAEMNGDALFDWLHENYTTKWVANVTEDGPPEPERVDANTLKVHFTSAWSPPYNFYKLLVKKWKDLSIAYEYHCWESGFIGYGLMVASSPSEPNHCHYDTLAELEAFLVDREWHVDTCNPQLEYYEGNRSKFETVKN